MWATLLAWKIAWDVADVPVKVTETKFASDLQIQSC